METLERISLLIEMTIIISKDQNSYWDAKHSPMSVFCRLIGKNKKIIIGAFKGRKNDKLLGELLNNNNSRKKQCWKIRLIEKKNARKVFQ